MGIALRLAFQCQCNEMVEHWLKKKKKSRKHGFLNCCCQITEIPLIRRKTPNKQIFCTVIIFTPCLLYSAKPRKSTQFKSRRIWLKAPSKLIFSPFPKQALVFTCLQYKSLKSTAGKGEIARNDQFLLFPVFSSHLENFVIFIKFEILVYKHFHFGRI